MISGIRKFIVCCMEYITGQTTDLFSAINRLDRLTSGLMIIPLSAERASSVSKEFIEGTIRKEYIARCKGEFPACVPSLPSASILDFDLFLQREVVCEAPLLTVDRQMGLNIVHPDGKVGL